MPFCGGDPAERADVLRETRSTEAEPGVEKGFTDTAIRADAGHDVGHVGADALAHGGDLVDERDLRGQERVGGVLDHLGGPHVGRDDRRAQRRVEIAHRGFGGGVRNAEDDAIGMHEICDRRTFAQKLGIRQDLDVVAGGVVLADDRGDEVARLDRDRGLVDDELGGVERFGDLARRRADVAQIREAVGKHGRPNGDEDDLRAADSLRDRRRER